MNDKTGDSPFRAWKRQEDAVQALCDAVPGPVKPKFPDMMRATIDAGLLAISKKAKRAKR